jgi:hypothetical protein
MKLLKVHYALLFMTSVSVATAEEGANCHESLLYMIVEGDTGQVQEANQYAVCPLLAPDYRARRTCRHDTRFSRGSYGKPSHEEPGYLVYGRDANVEDTRGIIFTLKAGVVTEIDVGDVMSVD